MNISILVKINGMAEIVQISSPSVSGPEEPKMIPKEAISGTI